MPFFVEKGDLVSMNVDVIVNASNVNLSMVEGVGRAIYHKAGDSELAKACKTIGHCDVGDAVMTPSFGLTNTKAIIHVPALETDPVQSATSPYGESKVMNERILTDISKVHKEYNIALLRYFNPIGAHQSGLLGDNPNGIPNNLLPYVSQVATGVLPELKVYGNDYPTPDGT